MTKMQWQMTAGGAMDFVPGIWSATTGEACFFAPLMQAKKGGN